MGSTYVCKECRIAIKYYQGSKEHDFERSCPKCGKTLAYEFVPEIARNMSEAVIRYIIEKDKERYKEGIWN